MKPSYALGTLCVGSRNFQHFFLPAPRCSLHGGLPHARPLVHAPQLTFAHPTCAVGGHLELPLPRAPPPHSPLRTPARHTHAQWVDIWNCLYRERIIFLSKPVDDELGNQVSEVSPTRKKSRLTLEQCCG